LFGAWTVFIVFWRTRLRTIDRIEKKKLCARAIVVISSENG